MRTDLLRKKFIGVLIKGDLNFIIHVEISSYPQEGGLSLSESIMFSIPRIVDILLYTGRKLRISLGQRRHKIVIMSVGGVIICVVIIYLTGNSVSCC